MNAHGYRQQTVLMGGMVGARSQQMPFDRKDMAIFRALFHLTLVALAVVSLFFIVGCNEGWTNSSAVSIGGHDDLETILPPSSDSGILDFSLDDLLS